MEEIQCFTSQKDIMLKIRHLVSKSYYFHAKGSFHKKDSKKILLKFSDRYGVFNTRGQRDWKKRKGEARSYCILLKTKNSPERIHFWLLASEGKGLIFDLEDMQDCRKKESRITTSDEDYYLVKSPNKNGAPRWTWRLSSSHYDSYKERIRRAIRNKNDHKLRQLHYSIVRISGFSDARKQGFALLRYMNSEWKRIRKCSEKYPFEGSYIGYIGRFKKVEQTPV
ncbi:hypothetical protein [Candidatus Sororendozoicomonas aggregata]|uniref:hypothetical protein n=1 Tax=Candidatus Sororendozoicomonas aggregata TaxID=3073239 RepID=UPI002ED2A91A